jgi:Protein of unknown function (DUF3631)
MARDPRAEECGAGLSAMPKPAGRPEPAAEALLRDLRDLFRERGAERLTTAAIVTALGERPGRPITANRLARTLGPVGVKPRQFRVGGRQTWGYTLADLPEIPNAGLSVESCDDNPPIERRDAGVVEPPVPVAVAAPEPGIGIAGQDHLDLAQEWATRLAMAAVGR